MQQEHKTNKAVAAAAPKTPKNELKNSSELKGKEEIDALSPIEIKKKKRKTNRKKTKTNNTSEEKVENLISKTFQEKIKYDLVGNLEDTEQNMEKNSPIQTSSHSEKSKEAVMAARAAKKAAKRNSKSDDTKEQQSHQKIAEEQKSTTNEQHANKNKQNHEGILVEREEKKLAKQPAKTQHPNKTSAVENPHSKVDIVENCNNTLKSASHKVEEKTRADILAEREAKKLAKQQAKEGKLKSSETSDQTSTLADKVIVKVAPVEIEKKPALTKAERRAIQETQRAIKADKLTEKQTPKKVELQKSVKNVEQQFKKSTDASKEIKIEKSNVEKVNLNACRIKLFNHLDRNFDEKNLFINNSQIHPAMIRLGEQYEKRTVVGSNARCIAFLNALKMVIQDYVTPPKKEFARSLEENIKNCIDHLNKCRPLAVSVSNAHKYIKISLTKLESNKPESKLKEILCDDIDIYIRDQIEKAALAISSVVQEKISNGDVILTFGCSSLISHILEEAYSRKIDFRVIVVDSRPFCEGQELLRRLAGKEISCTYVLINAIGFVMPEVTKILMGAHAILANGYVMARIGTAQIAMIARSFNVPVLVCCETHKFSERVQTDAFVFNELGNPNDLVMSRKCKLANWQTSSFKLTPLNLNYDITPPELVTAVITELAILPCTSVPVILRLRPTEIGY